MAIVTFVRDGGSPLALAESLSKRFSEQLLILELDEFADGETQLTFGQRNVIVGENITIVWQFGFRDINSEIFDLLLSIGTIKRMGASTIKLILPYLPYSRQDVSLAGLDTGPITTLMDLFLEAGVDEITSLELHSLDLVRFSRVIIKEIECSKFWKRYLEGQDIVVVSPDEGGKYRAKILANLLGVDFGYITKERYAVDKTRALELHGDVKGKSIVLVDDIIDTAGTAINACNMLIEQGATSVTGCFVHGVFSKDAKKLIENSVFDKVFVTDSIPSNKSEGKVQVLSMIDFFGEMYEQN